MNLRINSNSIRFRVASEDYLALCSTHAISQQTEFASGLRITYEVRYGALPTPTVDNALHLQTNVSPEGLHLILTVGPRAQVAIGTPNPSKEGIRDYQPTPAGSLLTIVLQRDTSKT
jgi:hypothetical protein